MSSYIAEARAKIRSPAPAIEDERGYVSFEDEGLEVGPSKRTGVTERAAETGMLLP